MFNYYANRRKRRLLGGYSIIRLVGAVQGTLICANYVYGGKGRQYIHS